MKHAQQGMCCIWYAFSLCHEVSSYVIIVALLLLLLRLLNSHLDGHSILIKSLYYFLFLLHMS